MRTWTNEELNKVGAAEELQIASERDDGTMRKPVTIWVVRVGNDLYVRSVNGRSAGWFRGVHARHRGLIRAGGIEQVVTCVDVDRDGDVSDQIDAAYRSKYRRYAPGIVNSTVTPEARGATLRLEPRQEGRPQT